MEPTELLIITATGGSVGSAVFVLCQMLRQAQAMNAAAANEIILTETESPLMRVFLPMARGIGAGMRGMCTGKDNTGLFAGLHHGVDRSLSAAGRPQGINADEFIGFGMLLGLFCAFAAGLMHIFLTMDQYYPWPFSAIGGGFVGALYWRGWLGRKKFERHQAVRKQLPFALDLLTLAVEAGLDFTSAMARIVRKLGTTPLGQEFALLLHEIQLGKTRAQALRDLANRLDLQEARSVTASLIQADEMGASLGPVLRIQASQQREKRSQRAEEQAMQAPVKMLFPLTVFIFPTTLLLLFTPLAIRFMSSFALF